jgi:hypothetical protein
MTDLLTFARQLRAAYCRETSELERQWKPGTPSTGQCHVSAWLIQQQFGGIILEGRAGTALWPVHYWNVLDGITVDITRDQFTQHAPVGWGKPADPPLQVTVEKARLLAHLAGIEAA